jgi:hypothetical protein
MEMTKVQSTKPTKRASGTVFDLTLLKPAPRWLIFYSGRVSSPKASSNALFHLLPSLQQQPQLWSPKVENVDFS